MCCCALVVFQGFVQCLPVHIYLLYQQQQILPLLLFEDYLGAGDTPSWSLARLHKGERGKTNHYLQGSWLKLLLFAGRRQMKENLCAQAERRNCFVIIFAALQSEALEKLQK